MKSLRRCLLASLLLVSTARGQDAFDVAAWAPADSVLVFAWSGADQARDGFDKSRLGKLWSQPEMREFFATPVTSAWNVLRKEAAKQIPAERFELLEATLSQLWHQPVMLCVFPTETDSAWPAPVGIALILRAGDGGDERAKSLLDWLAEAEGHAATEETIDGLKFKLPTKDAPFYFATREGRWIMTFGKPAATRLARAKSKTLADNPAHRRARKAIGDVKPYTYSCVDMIGARKLAFDVAGALSGTPAPAPIVLHRRHAALENPDVARPPPDEKDEESEPEKPAEGEINLAQAHGRQLGIAASMVAPMLLIFQGTGTIGSAEFATARTFDGPYMHTIGYARADEAHPLLFDYVDSKPLDRKSLNFVPPDAISFSIDTFDAIPAYMQTLQTIAWAWKEFTQRVPAAAHDGPPDKLAEWITDQLGVDIEKDVLSHFGTHWLTYSRPGLLSTAVCIEVRDADALRERVEALLDRLPEEVKFKPRKVGDETLHVLDLSKAAAGSPIPVSPCWGLTKDRLILSLDFNAARQLLRHLTTKPEVSDETKPITERPAIKELLAKQRQLSSIRWQDEEQTFLPMYGQLSLFYPIGTNMIANMEPRIKFEPLPGIKDFTRYMSQTASWSTVDGAARIDHSLAGIPTIGATLSPTTTALALSIMLPSLSRARELSKRAVCASNLHAMAHAMYIYASENNDNFPPDFRPMIKGNYMTEKMFICPSAAVKLGDLDACYIYIPGQSTNSNPTNVLAYEKEDNHHEGANVLFVDSHVDFIKPYSKVKELVKQTKKRLANEKKK